MINNKKTWLSIVLSILIALMTVTTISYARDDFSPDTVDGGGMKKVTGVECNDNGNGSANIRWNAVEGATGYIVEAKEATSEKSFEDYRNI